MKNLIAVALCATVTLMPCEPAFAWGHANAYGRGDTAHYGDTTTRTSGYGGEATHTAGEGTSYENKEGDSAYHAEGSGTTTGSNAYGGSATHYAGVGTTATNGEGGAAYHAEGSGSTTAVNGYGGSATHYAGVGTVGTTSGGATYAASDHYYGAAPTAYGYHPPVVVNSYSTGCYDCGGWSSAGAAVAGLAVGAAVGASVASANNAANTSNAYAAGAAAGSANTAAAYNAGVVAGASAAPYYMGEIIAAPPSGCASPIVRGITYFLCGGSTWIQPSYGANGVFYRVVPAP